MAKPIYFALGFSQPGCICNSVTPYAVTTRREITDAVRGSFSGDDDASGAQLAMADLGIRSLWGHLKAHGASVIFRELRTGTSEVLCFMGLTEAEYDAADVDA